MVRKIKINDKQKCYFLNLGVVGFLWKIMPIRRPNYRLVVSFVMSVARTINVGFELLNKNANKITSSLSLGKGSKNY